MADKRVVVAVPSGDMMHSDCAVSLANMFLKSKTSIIGLLNYRSSVLAQSRNESVRIAIEGKATHILFIDSDIKFPPETLDRLISHNKRIVGGSYCTRDAREMRLGIPYDKYHDTDEPLRRMKAIAMGCVLIDLTVFEQLDVPWFNFLYNNGEFVDEGYFFCMLIHNAGIAMYEDKELSLRLAHVGIKHFIIKKTEE